MEKVKREKRLKIGIKEVFIIKEHLIKGKRRTQMRQYILEIIMNTYILGKIRP